MSGKRVFRRATSPIWYGWVYEGGKRVQRSTQCTDKRAAEAIVRQWERDASDPAHAAARTATLRSALALVIKRADSLASTGRRATATADFYRAKIGHLARLFEPDDVPFMLARINAASVDAYVDQRRAEGAGESTISKEIGALRLALKLAKRVGLWLGDLETVMPVLMGTHYVPKTRWLTHDEVQRLLGELVQDRAARVAFLVATGARWGESDRAMRQDVGPDFVRVRGTKTARAARVVPLVLEEQRTLMEYAVKWSAGNEAMFLPWGNVRRDLLAACDRAGILPCSPNDLRRTLAHWLRQRGAGADLVAPVLGHADARMVQRVYGKLEGTELAAALSAATGCSNSAATLLQRPDFLDSLEVGRSQKPAFFSGFSVPRDGIEPPTRGFSIPVRLWPTPRKDEISTSRRRSNAAIVQQNQGRRAK